jgi:hypothetical protein
LYLSHLVSFPCTDHILYASLVSVTPRQFLMYSSHITIIFFRFQSWLININILHCNLLLNCVILYKYDMRSCLENYIYLFIIKLICFLFLGKQRRMCKRKCKRGMYTEINITSFLILNLWLVTLQSISNDVPIFLSYKSKTYNWILKKYRPDFEQHAHVSEMGAEKLQLNSFYFLLSTICLLHIEWKTVSLFKCHTSSNKRSKIYVIDRITTVVFQTSKSITRNWMTIITHPCGYARSWLTV